MNRVQKEIDHLADLVRALPTEKAQTAAPAVEITPEQIEMLETWLSTNFADPEMTTEDLAKVPPLPPPFEFINATVELWRLGCDWLPGPPTYSEDEGD
jgi:hypothetical protein